MIEIVINPLKHTIAGGSRVLSLKRLLQKKLPNSFKVTSTTRLNSNKFGNKRFIILPIATINCRIASGNANADKQSVPTITTTTIRNTTTEINSSRQILIRLLNSIPLHNKIMPFISEKLPNVVFVLGGPGAGKGTQCTKIVENFGFVHLSAGDLLREERNKPGSKYGELIEKHIRDGTIVPVEITCSLIERAMNESGSNLFLIDGFPRNQNNLEGWEKEMSDKVNVLFVLFFDAPEEVCVERCLSRGQLGSGRSDDNPDSLKKRVNTYVNDTMPIVNYFVGKNLVNKVDASLSPDQVFGDVKTIFDGILGRQVN